MLATMLLVLLFLGFALMTGHLVLAVFNNRYYQRPGDRLIMSLWLGTLTLAVLLMGISNLMPLTFNVLLGLSGGLAGACCLFKSSRQRLLETWQGCSVSLKVMCLAAAAVSAIYAVRPLTTNLDTGMYHSSIIKWLAEYGTVKGIALLNFHYGLLSTQFSLAAPFHNLSPDFRFIGITGAWYLALVFISLAVGSIRILRRKAEVDDWFLVVGIALVLPYYFRLALPTTPSPNFAVNILMVMVPWSIFVVAREARSGLVKERYNVLDGSGLPVLLATLAFVHKLNAAPALLLAAGYFTLHHLFIKPYRVLATAAICAAVLSVFMYTSYQFSACPLFPADYFCGNEIWKQGPNPYAAYNFAITSGNATNHARWWEIWPYSNGLIFSYLVFSVLALVGLVVATLRTKQTPVILIPLAAAASIYAQATEVMVPLWIGPLFGILCMAIVLGFSLLTWTPSKQKEKLDLYPYLWLIPYFALATYMLWTKGPSVRFGLGFSAVLPAALLGAILSQRQLFPRWIRQPTMPAATFAAVAVISLVVLGGTMRRAYTETLLPKMVAEGVLTIEEDAFSPLVLPYKLLNFQYTGGRIMDIDYQYLKNPEGISYWFPGSPSMCWNAPLPCTPNRMHPELKLMDEAQGIAGGFYVPR